MDVEYWVKLRRNIDLVTRFYSRKSNLSNQKEYKIDETNMKKT